MNAEIRAGGATSGGWLRAATVLYALAAIATGVADVVWRAFDPAEEPIQTFGNHVPGRELFALIVGAVLVIGGLALLRRGAGARIGATLLAAVYTIFAIFNAPRLYTAPHYLGLHVGVVAGVLVGVFQQLILVAAALIAIVTASPRCGERSRHAVAVVTRCTFGIGALDFGCAHLYGLAATAQMVPAYLPFGQVFWVALTGIAFILAGIAILSGALDVLAARLLALMLAVFGVLALPPHIAAYPHAHAAWGVNVYNLAAVAAVWIYAEWRAQDRARAKPARSRMTEPLQA